MFWLGAPPRAAVKIVSASRGTKMSRAYGITVKESLKKDLAASDEVCSDLEILEILPPEQMAELLRGELKERGFQEQEGKLVRRDEGIIVTVDPTVGEISV